MANAGEHDSLHELTITNQVESNEPGHGRDDIMIGSGLR